ncbi:MAG: universal stress protein [Thermoleophilia bacterium]
MPVIVVGIDGSDASRAALRFALEEARLRGASVRAVCAWEVPLDQAMPGPVIGGLPLEYGIPIEDLRDLARREAATVLDQALAAVRDEAAGVEVVSEPVEGRAAHVLVEAAADAELLVVGSRGHGGFAGLLLGSVGQACAHHARCPVAVIRPQTA